MNALTGSVAGLLVAAAVLLLVVGDMAAVTDDGIARRRRSLSVAGVVLSILAVALMVTRFLWLAR